MSTPSFASRLFVATLALFVAGSSTAQNASFEEAIDVSLVNVEVFVSDKNGNPITGLTERDFTLFEDKKRVDITNFVELRPEEVEAEVASIGSRSDEGSDAAPDHLVLFLDDFAFAPKEREALIARMSAHVEEKLSPSIRVAVVSYDSTLNIHQPFTTDHGAVREALDRLSAFNPRSTARYAERERTFRSALETLRSIQDGSIGTGTIPAAAGGIAGADLDDSGRRLLVAMREIDADAQQMRAENQRAIGELAQLVNALGSLPGRKALVHVSQGMPIRPWEELYEAIGETFRQVRVGSDLPATQDERQADLDQRSAALGAIDRSGSSERRGDGLANDLGELTALANASRVSFYTIRPFAQSSLPAEFAGSVAGLYTPSMMATRDANLRETAQLLADRTGGVTLAGGDLGELLERAESDFRGYYSLAYRPEPGRAPGLHDFKVKVKGRGRVVRYRKGFFEKPPEARFGDRASAALLLERADNPLGLEIELVDPVPEGSDGLRAATLVVVIPLEEISLEAVGPGRWTIDGQIYLAVNDPLGGTAPVQLVDLQIPVDAENEAAARSDRYGARMRLLVSPGSQKIAVGFVDRRSGVESYVAATFDVP